MGIASSTSGSLADDEDHFSTLIEMMGSKKPTNSSVYSGGIAPAAEILLQVSWEKMWDTFLSGPYTSFAVTPSEAEHILLSSLESYHADENKNQPQSEAQKIKDEKATKAYVQMFVELSATSLLSSSISDPTAANKLVKALDFMAVISSVLLLSDSVNIESKVDQLFDWIVLGTKDGFDEENMTFDEFYLAMTSFEKGLSHALGKRSMSLQGQSLQSQSSGSSVGSNYVRAVSSQWMSLADPLHKGSVDATTRVSKKNFFDFCTNRQHIVRRLLEALEGVGKAARTAALRLGQPAAMKLTELSEVDDTVEALLQKEPKGAHLKTSNFDAQLNYVSIPAGDEWMSNPTWKKTAERMLTAEAKKAYINAKPTASLSLDWVHGYRGFDCRNNVFYADKSGGKVFFSAAALSIVQDSSKQLASQRESRENCSQVYFGEHADDIISIAKVDLGDGMLMASGEIGKTPAVHLYKLTPEGTFLSLACMKGYHSKGVSQLCFSSDGKQLFSVGVEYTVAVYCTDENNLKQFGKMIASAQGPKSKVLHVCSSSKVSTPSSYEFLSCGEKHAIRWAGSLTGSLQQENIKLGSTKSMFMSVCGLPDGDYLMCSYEGEILHIRNSKVIAMKLDSSAINSDTVNSKAVKEKGKDKNNKEKKDDFSFNCSWIYDKKRPTLVTGGKDGRVIMWQLSLDSSTCNAVQQISVGIATRAVCVSDNMKKLLIGTQRCSILEIELPSNGSACESFNTLVSGHFKDEVWGLAVRPPVPGYPRQTGKTECNSGYQYATAGDDGFVRIWDAVQRKELIAWDMEFVVRAIAFTPDGSTMAVGFGGSVTASKAAMKKWNGIVRIYRIGNDWKLLLVAEIKEAKQCISVLKYSPDGLTLAAGSKDNSVYLYSVPQQYKRKAKFSKHNAGIIFLDFSKCSKYMQTCCRAYELLFSSTDTGNMIPDGATKFISEKWATWTCSLGWPVLGIWSGTMDGSDVNAVDRSPCGQLLATADDFGKVSLFRYPCIGTGDKKITERAEYLGHSSHVTSVQWLTFPKSRLSKDGDAKEATTKSIEKDNITYLLSTGGEDKCVFQWKVIYPETTDRKNDLSHHGEAEDVDIDNDDTGNHSTEDGDDEFEAPQGGDEFTAIKPWLGAIVPPTAWANPSAGGKAHPFYAALSELSIQHGALAKGNAWKESSSIFENIKSLEDNVLQKMYESGVSDATAPTSDDIELEWVHGYRGFDCRNNVFYVDYEGSKSVEERRLVYYCAALGVVLDPTLMEQSYFKGHTDDILSMALFSNPSTSPPKTIVATGQQGLGRTFVWEVESLKTLATLETKQKSVNMLCFSKGDSGRLLISIAEDKSVAVSDWKSQTVLCNTKGEPAPTHHVVASSGSENNKGVTTFLSCGDKHVRFWTLNGRNLTASKVSTQPILKSPTQQFLCAVAVNQLFLVGAEDGSIYVIPPDGKAFKHAFSPIENQAGKESKAKEKTKEDSKSKTANAVTALTYVEINPSMKRLVSGHKDGFLHIFDVTNMSEKNITVSPPKLSSINMADLFPTVIIAKQIQSVSVRYFSDKALLLCVSTRGCDIVEVKVAVSGGGHGEVFDVNGSKGVVMRAHCNDELWGLATHPHRPQYCTVGDDKTMRFFDVHTKRMIGPAEPLGFMARSVCYSNSGACVVVGFGGRVGKGKESGGGKIRIYSPAYEKEISTARVKEAVPAKKLCERQDSKQWISDVKFSSDDKTLVAGGHDCKIYVYNISIVEHNGVAESCELKLRCTFAKHNSVISHFDLSNDGRYMQSNCAGYELLFCELSTGKQITSATELRDVKWHTWTCTLGWPVQGIWRPGMDGSDINAVARSHSGHLLTMSDDFGKVNLFRYPCIGVDPTKANAANSGSKKPPPTSLARAAPGSQASSCSSFMGHSSHVMSVRWTALDECLISCGGNDKCVMQWRHVMASNFGGVVTQAEPSSGSKSPARTVKFSLEKGKDSFHGHSDSEGEDDSNEPADDVFADSPGGGDESGAVKPWLGAIKAPSNPPPISPQPPAALLQLQWIHGYTSASAGANNSKISNNLFYNSLGNPCYPAAAMCIQLSNDTSNSNLQLDPFNKSSLKQQYFRGHTDDILCVAIDRSRRYLATGQTAAKGSKGKGSIILWDATSCRQLSKIEGQHQRAVTNLSFSWDGSMLLSVGQDDNCTHYIWSDTGGNWSRVTLLTSQKGDKGNVFFSLWIHPSNDLAQKKEAHFLSGGATGVNFWKIQGSALSKKAGRFGRKYKEVPLLCSANLTGTDKKWRMILGTSTGDLYVFDDREVSTAVEKAHAGAVLCIAEGVCGCGDSETITYLVTGGKDHSVKVWNQSLQPVSQFDVGQLSLVEGSVASVDIKPSAYCVNLTLLLGTYGGEIIELQAHDNSNNNNNKGNAIAVDNTHGNSNSVNLDLTDASSEVLIHSHYSGELWGVATHPYDTDIFASAGDDGSVRIWSIKKNCMLGHVNVGHAVRSVTWHPSGSIIAVGLFETVKGGYRSNTSNGGNKANSKNKKKKTTNSVPESATSAEVAAVKLFSVQLNGPPGGDETIVKICEGCSSIAWISELKFHKLSEDDTYLAVGSHDKKLYMYKVPSHEIKSGSLPFGSEWDNCLKLELFKFDKHSSAVLHVDFSSDGSYFQSNCQAGELLFGSLKDGRQESSASKLADYNNNMLGIDDDDDDEVRMWETQTCKLGWPVQGIWPPCSDLSDINSVDRSPNFKLLATADDNGLVKLFRYPVISKESKYLSYEGHSSHVTNVRWTTGSHLISSGGNDKCLFVWHLTEH